MDKDKYKFKIAVLGEPNIGKSALNTLCTRHFGAKEEEMHEKVYGVSFAVEVLESIDVNIILVVWNFTGQDEYKKIQQRHLEGVSGVLLLFDLTRKQTFDKLPSWLEVVGLNIPNVPVILVGTMADKFSEKEIPDRDIENFHNTFKLQGYSEVSFKTGFNFEPTIQMLADSVFQFRTLGKKSFKELNIRRYGDSPIIINEERTIETISLAIDEITCMISGEIKDKIRALKEQKDIEGSEFVPKIEDLKEEISDYDSRLESLNNNIPISSSIFYNQLNEWKKIKKELIKNLDELTI
jgi:Ras-related protein Rab-2A